MLRSFPLQGVLCRQSASPCVPVDAAQTGTPLVVARDPGSPAPVVWTDHLPSSLLFGEPRPVAYRVELRNAAGHSAGFSDPSYAAAGTAPPPVTGLSAQGTRLGIALQWSPVPGKAEVLLQRTGPAGPAGSVAPSTPAAEHTSPARQVSHAPGGGTRTARKTDPGMDWLEASPDGANVSVTLDTSATEGVPYRYVAVRREKIQAGGRTLELRSAPSAPVAFLWRDIYPPVAPTELSAIGYRTAPDSPGTAAAASGSLPTYAVDLVWRPVLDPRLAGYLVFRQRIDAAGHAIGPRQRLTAEPVTTPGYHDGTAAPDARYRYSVSAIDPKQNQSSTAETVLEPTGP